MGSAWETVNPTPRAASANTGQRLAASVRSTLVIARPLAKQSRHGPSAFCSSNSSSNRADSSV